MWQRRPPRCRKCGSVARKRKPIDLALVVPDDIIKVKIGDIVAADAWLLGGGDFVQVDQSALTGESLPMHKKMGDDLYAISIIRQEETTTHVTATGARNAQPFSEDGRQGRELSHLADARDDRHHRLRRY